MFEAAPPPYQGEVDAQGLPHGQGSQTFMDGSAYKGQFEHGMSQGEGTWTHPSGESYSGTWFAGMKHGKGTKTLMNGDRIIAEWENDILNGKGTFISKNGDEIEAVWKGGLMIPMESQDRCCFGNAILNIILVLITFACFGLAASDPNGAVLGLIFYFIQLGEAICCNSTYRYLKNIIPLSQTGVRINQLKATRPRIFFTIQCYHFETRVETYKDAQGNQQTRTRRVRINTHHANEDYHFNQWTDTSPNPNSIGHITELHMTRLNFFKKFEFTSYARYAYERQIKSFKYHNIRDVHYDFSITKRIPGLEENVCVYNQEKGELPWFANQCTYVLSALLFFSWFLRIKFINQSTRVSFTMTKLILN